MTEYKPGVCNIDNKESRKRLLAGAVAFLSSILVFLTTLGKGIDTYLFITVFSLNFAGFIGVLQYRKNFCTGLALKKKFRVGENSGEVSDSENVSKDRKKAVLMLIQSLVGTTFLTAIMYAVAGNI